MSRRDRPSRHPITEAILCLTPSMRPGPKKFDPVSGSLGLNAASRRLRPLLFRSQGGPTACSPVLTGNPGNFSR